MLFTLWYKFNMAKRDIIEGQPVLIVIDIQGGEMNFDPDEPITIPLMDGYDERMEGAPALIEKARECNIPIIFFQEAHRRDLVDFGRELDGAEGVHLLEGDSGTEISKAIGMRPDDYFIRKRRYSCFFGTELEILLKDTAALAAMEYLQTGACRSSEEIFTAFKNHQNTENI